MIYWRSFELLIYINQLKDILQRKLPDSLKLSIAKQIENNLFSKVPGYSLLLVAKLHSVQPLTFPSFRFRSWKDWGELARCEHFFLLRFSISRTSESLMSSSVTSCCCQLIFSIRYFSWVKLLKPTSRITKWPLRDLIDFVLKFGLLYILSRFNDK